MYSIEYVLCRTGVEVELKSCDVCMMALPEPQSSVHYSDHAAVRATFVIRKPDRSARCMCNVLYFTLYRFDLLSIGLSDCYHKSNFILLSNISQIPNLLYMD